MPWPLQVAIEHGLVVLGWYENLSKDEVPPEHLWEDPEGLEMWWATVEDRRKNDEDGPGASAGRSSVPDADADHEEGMAENQLAAALKRG